MNEKKNNTCMIFKWENFIWFQKFMWISVAPIWSCDKLYLAGTKNWQWSYPVISLNISCENENVLCTWNSHNLTVRVMIQLMVFRALILCAVQIYDLVLGI